MQTEGGDPWTGTVFGHRLERSDKRKSSVLETQVPNVHEYIMRKSFFYTACTPIPDL